MKIKRAHLYIANLDPRFGTEAGKQRPVLVMQTDLLNEQEHPSTWILPCTTGLSEENLLRVHIPKEIAGNSMECDVMIDQSYTIDNRRFKKQLRKLPELIMKEVVRKLKILGDL